MQFNEELELLEDDIEEKKAEKVNSRVRCWVGTWNNPKMTDKEFEEFLNNQYVTDTLLYAIFQREVGEQGTVHFQFFVNYKNPQYFKKLKTDLLPYGCHFKPMRTTKTFCKNYCSKEETRVSGPYEIGEFIEERARTDQARAVTMVASGVSMQEISETFQTTYVQNRNKIKDYKRDLLEWKYSSVARNVEVIYIYGPPRTGKTTYVYSQVEGDPSKIFVIDTYDKFMFTGYVEQKAVLFDEFTGQVNPITYMNKLLEPWPRLLNIKGGNTPACFDKVYIVSNYPLNQIYKEAQETLQESYKAFCQRINKIIHFTDFQKY